MKDCYITRKLGYDYVNHDDVRTSLVYIFKLYKMNTTSNRYDCVWKGVFFIDEIEELEEKIVKICSDNAFSILYSRDTNIYIQRLCQLKMEYGSPIKIYYEQDEV